MTLPRPALMVLLLLALLAAGPGRTAAGEPEEGVLFLGADRVSTPAGREQPLAESPSSVTVITREEIERSGALTLAEAVSWAAGVDTLRRSEANLEISLRGFNTYGSTKVLVMLDSRPLFNLADAAVNWALFPVPLAEVERIEIVRGPGAVLYGENAVFGTINIITRPAQGGPQYLRAGYGTGPSFAGTASVRLTGFTFAAEHLALDRFHERRSSIPNPFFDHTGLEAVTAAVVTDRGFFRWEPGPGTLATGGFAQTDTDYGRFHTVDRLAFVSLDQRFNYEGIAFQAGLRLLGQDQRVSEAPFPRGEYQRFLRFDADLRGVYSPASWDTLVFGARLSHRTVEDDVYLVEAGDEFRQPALGVFAENQLAFLDRRAFLLTGVRVDMTYGRNGIVSPRAGLVLLLNPRHSLKLGWGEAFRNPTIYELHAVDRTVPPWVFRGDPGLEAEHLTSWNLDYLYLGPGCLTFSAGLFYNDLSNLIVFRRAGLSATERAYRLDNEDRAYAYGGELEIKTRLADRVELWFNYSFNEAHYREAGEWTVAPFSPRHKANAGAAYLGSRWSFQLWASYVGKQTGVNFDAPIQDRVDLNDYAVVSARATFNFTPELQLALTVSDPFSPGHYEAPTYAPVTPYYFVELVWHPGW